jgi:hypothetical protein
VAFSVHIAHWVTFDVRQGCMHCTILGIKRGKANQAPPTGQIGINPPFAWIHMARGASNYLTWANVLFSAVIQTAVWCRQLGAYLKELMVGAGGPGGVHVSKVRWPRWGGWGHWVCVRVGSDVGTALCGEPIAT